MRCEDEETHDGTTRENGDATDSVEEERKEGVSQGSTIEPRG